MKIDETKKGLIFRNKPYFMLKPLYKIEDHSDFYLTTNNETNIYFWTWFFWIRTFWVRKFLFDFFVWFFIFAILTGQLIQNFLRMNCVEKRGDLRGCLSQITVTWLSCLSCATTQHPPRFFESSWHLRPSLLGLKNFENVRDDYRVKIMLACRISDVWVMSKHMYFF